MGTNSSFISLMINWSVAFAYFDPTTFEISAMSSNAESLYSDFTALKDDRPWVESDCKNEPNW